MAKLKQASGGGSPDPSWAQGIEDAPPMELAPQAGGSIASGGGTPFGFQAGPTPGSGSIPAMSGEKPKDSMSLGAQGFGPSPGSSAAPTKLHTPSPMAGSQFQAGPQQESAGIVPFPPMSSSSEVGLGNPAKSGLFGSMRGLKGGGLGLPLDPVSNETSPDISGLIQMLMSLKGR